jgi:hypothetical protein
VALEASGGASDPVAGALRALLQIGFAWRFYGSAEALALTTAVLREPTVAANPSLGAGPRFLPSFDAPAGAVAMGELLAASPHPDLARSGLLAQLLGEIALGRPTQARAIARRFLDRERDPAARLFIAELFAMHARFAGGEGSEGGDPELAALAAPGAGSAQLRGRATWMWHLTARGPGGGGALGAPFSIILLADSLGRAGHHTEALAMTDSFALDPYLGTADPFLRAALHLLRAEWHAAAGDLAAARRALRWHENTDLLGHPIGAPQAGEVDWAFGTVGRWRRAAVLEQGGFLGEELCGALRGVERHWRGGEKEFAARADSAHRRAAALGCTGVR